MQKRKLAEIPDIVYTHSGNFHADDVFSSAFLKLCNENIQIIRVNELPSQDVFAYDIGLGEFDHHQQNNQKRNNGIPYAAFGKLWNAYGRDFLETKKQVLSSKSHQIAEHIDEKFIGVLDLTDNSSQNNILSMAIYGLNSTWDGNRQQDFDKAVNIAMELFSAIIDHEIAGNMAYDEIRKIYEDSTNKSILVLPTFIPYSGYLKHRNTKFVIFPSNRIGWQVMAIKESDKQYKLLFPKKYRGIKDKDGIIFCHPQGFTLVTETKQKAIDICQEVIRDNPDAYEGDYSSFVGPSDDVIIGGDRYGQQTKKPKKIS